MSIIIEKIENNLGHNDNNINPIPNATIASRISIWGYFAALTMKI